MRNNISISFNIFNTRFFFEIKENRSEKSIRRPLDLFSTQNTRIQEYRQSCGSKTQILSLLESEGGNIVPSVPFNLLQCVLFISLVQIDLLRPKTKSFSSNLLIVVIIESFQGKLIIYYQGCAKYEISNFQISKVRIIQLVSF